MPRRRLDFPWAGRNDDRSYTDQPLATTRQAVNVRGYSPKSGRLQGGQRSGLSAYLGNGNQPLAGENTPVQALASISYAQATHSYAAMGNPGAASSPNPVPTIEWEKVLPLKDECLDVQLDLQQNAWALSAAGTVVKLNADGTVIYSHQVPIQAGESVGRRFALDGDAGVYVGVASSSGTRVFRYLETDDGDGLEVQWIHATEGTEVADMVLEGGVLYVAINHEDADEPSRVMLLDGLVGSTPIEVLSRDVPKPVNNIAFSRGGLVFSCPPNVARGPRPVGGGVLASTVDWVPWDLTNAEERLHLHLSAFGLGGFSSGQEVTQWQDVRASERTEYVTAGGSPGTLVDTSTDRVFARPSYYVNNGAGTFGPEAPRYTTSALGPYPSLRFNNGASSVSTPPNDPWDYDNGSGLTSRGLTAGIAYRADKVSASAGTLPGSTGLWPNTFTHNFAITMLVRVPHSERQVLWHTGLYTGVNASPAAGWLALTVNDDGTGSYHGTDVTQNTIPAASPGGVSLYGPENVNILSANCHGTAATQAISGEELNLMLITLVVEGTGNSLQLRVQGADAGSAVTLDQSLISPSREVMGHRTFYESQQEAASQAVVRRALEGFDSFSGDVLECVTYFADSSADTSPHDDTGASWDAEIQRVEGYVAWKWGVQDHVLVSAHSWDGGTSAPTSGTGSVYDAIVPGATSAAMVSVDGILGKLDLSTGSALWAIDGSGIGYGLAVDPENDGIYTVGPNQSLKSDETGPMTVTTRKVTDKGLTVSADLPARASITVTAVPAEGATITLTDGTNAAQVFEFDTAGDGVAGGSIEIDSSGSPNAATLAQRIITAITGAGSGVCDVFALVRPTAADAEFPFQVDLWNRKTTTFTVEVSGTGLTKNWVTQATVAADGWTLNHVESLAPINQYMRCAVDFEGDLYVPRAQSSKQNHVIKYDRADGSELFTYNIGGGTDSFDGYAVALSRAETDWGSASITSPEFMWIANSNVDGGVANPDIETVSKVRLIQKTPLNVEPRTVAYRALSGGNLYGFSKGGQATQLATGVVTSGSIWIDSAVAFGELFITDNGTYKVHNPKKATTEEWKSKSGGEIPKGCKLIASYRGRVLLAAGDDPYMIHASKLGDPYNWDFFPREGADPARAWSGTSIEAVRSPDRVNALVPWYDHAVLVGGDRTITQIVGDPAAGGGFNLITDATGIAWDAACLASDGSVYFMGSRGGIWRIAPPLEGRIQPPQEITERSINRELTDIDFSQTKARLVWHEDEDALQVILARNTASTASVTTEHWWFESRTGAWWMDRFSNASRVPQTLAVFDGDEAGDRLVCFGCEDGRLRWWDRDALSDDGFPIESEVLIGPIVHEQQSEFEQKITAIEATLAGEFGGCRWELYAADDPEFFGEPVAAGDFKSGFSGRVRTRARGGTLWLKLANAAANQNWALESLFLEIVPGARRRVRA